MEDAACIDLEWVAEQEARSHLAESVTLPIETFRAVLAQLRNTPPDLWVVSELVGELEEIKSAFNRADDTELSRLKKLLDDGFKHTEHALTLANKLLEASEE